MFYLKLEKSNFKGNWFMDLMNWFYKLLSINPVFKKNPALTVLWTLIYWDFWVYL